MMKLDFQKYCSKYPGTGANLRHLRAIYNYPQTCKVFSTGI